ncbi:hypothetical protein [Actinacidiphila oryziradicis]|nr:hypothetical protein [Actinacidiphila oryziradicis]
MRPYAVDLTHCYQSVAVVNGTPTIVWVPKVDDVAEAAARVLAMAT